MAGQSRAPIPLAPLSDDGQRRLELLQEIVRLSPDPPRGPKSTLIEAAFQDFIGGGVELRHARAPMLERYVEHLRDRHTTERAKEDTYGYTWSKAVDRDGKAHAFTAPITTVEVENPRAICGAPARGRFSQLTPVWLVDEWCVRCIQLAEAALGHSILASIPGTIPPA